MGLFLGFAGYIHKVIHRNWGLAEPHAVISAMKLAAHRAIGVARNLNRLKFAVERIDHEQLPNQGLTRASQDLQSLGRL